MTDSPNNTTVKLTELRAALLDDIGVEEYQIAEAEYDQSFDCDAEDTFLSRND